MSGQGMGVQRANPFVMRRKWKRGPQQHERHATNQQLFTIAEGNLNFQVNFSEYLDTGLFLDQRVTRSMVRSAANGS